MTFILSTNSSNINIFTRRKHDYEQALKNCVYKTKLGNKSTDKTSNICVWGKNKSRIILWFTPPCNMTVANKLGKEFFKSSKKNYPCQRNNIKYSNKIQLNQIIVASPMLPT